MNCNETHKEEHHETHILTLDSAKEVEARYFFLFQVDREPGSGLLLQAMKAIAYKGYGNADCMEEVELPDPVPGELEILVKIHATSVNPVDWKIRSGSLKLITGNQFPRVPGVDFAGKVVDVGKHARRFRKGDSVFGMMPVFSTIVGTYATLVAIPEKFAAAAPANLPLEQCAAIPLAGLTALQSLRDRGGMKDGFRVLINGASGGVGCFATQIAKIYRGEVTAVTSGKNADFVRGLGADHIINYHNQDFTRIGEEFDLVLDCVSNSTFDACKRILAPNGTYVTLLPTASVLFHSVMGSVFGGKRCAYTAVSIQSDDLDILRQYAQGKTIEPRVDKLMPLNRAREAHELSESGRVRGKMVLTVSD
ncbi:MAG: NAD(P)-dependent alcohol dehydrogenase [Leptospirales bacterium]|nr:NAD(P)-dependent alcohol dehydrogenase [Leptospirales bacterium]